MLRSQIVPRIGVMGVLASLPMVRNPGRATAAPQEVNVKLTEWAIELSQSSIPAGEVTFTVSNAGSIPHAFEVEGKGIEQQPDLAGRQGRLLQIPVELGCYCLIPGG